MNPILFHGSDLKMLSLSKEIRHKYKNNCFAVAYFLWNIFEPYFNSGNQIPSKSLKDLQLQLPQEKYPYLYQNLVDKLTCFYCYLQESDYYKYKENTTYLCSSKDRASGYAYRAFAGGEIGLIAYRMIEAVRVLKVTISDMPQEIHTAIKAIDKMVAQNNQPVIIPVTNYDRNKLLLENGKKIAAQDFDFFTRKCSISFKYNGIIMFNLSKAIHLY